MQSYIDLTEQVYNRAHRFGQWNGRCYFPAMIANGQGVASRALFTENQIKRAIRRANKNREDWPKIKSLLSRLFGN